MGKRRGRPKNKNARRTASGRISRAKPVPTSIVRGNDRAQAMFALYGQDGTDAIGRAYTRGFLGADGKQLLDTARAIARAYWAWYAVGSYACPLGGRSGSSRADDHERERRQEDWLNSMLRERDRAPFGQRMLFDQLVINLNPDEGPAWLDRLLHKRGDQNDWGRLAAALEILHQCAGIPVRRNVAA